MKRTTSISINSKLLKKFDEKRTKNRSEALEDLIRIYVSSQEPNNEKEKQRKKIEQQLKQKEETLKNATKDISNLQKKLNKLDAINQVEKEEADEEVYQEFIEELEQKYIRHRKDEDLSPGEYVDEYLPANQRLLENKHGIVKTLDQLEEDFLNQVNN